MSERNDTMPQIQNSSQKFKFVIRDELTRFFECAGGAYIFVVAPNSDTADLLDTFVQATAKEVVKLSLNELEQRLVKAVCHVERTSSEAAS
jgi:hypothetical protein